MRAAQPARTIDLGHRDRRPNHGQIASVMTAMRAIPLYWPGRRVAKNSPPRMIATATTQMCRLLSSMMFIAAVISQGF
jgi:predicted Co/Zn/Cd cation transporter (cation efflux family)